MSQLQAVHSSPRLRECPPLPHLSEFARDALCVMAVLALPSPVPRSASLLSYELGLKPGRVDRLFRLLVRGHLLVVGPGRTGGARLTRPASAITLGEIYGAVGGEAAPLRTRCPLVSELDQLVTAWLARHNLAELALSMDAQQRLRD
jgi:DNA-binding IscR family transcriptional regulator